MAPLSRRRVLGGAASLVVGGAIAAEHRPERAPARRTRHPAHFVLVHGSFHGAWCWYRVAAALEARGHETTAVDLPSAGIDATPPNEVTLAAQADAVLALIDGLPERVVLVGHSAGGPVISMVAEARPERVSKLVYLSAYLLESGQSIVSRLQDDPESLVPPNLVVTGGRVFTRLDRVRDVFYGTCGDADVELARSLLKPVGILTTIDPVTVGASFESVRRFYVACRRDRAVTPDFQRTMYTALPCERVFAIRSDHSPFFSRPAALVRILEAVARA